MALTDRAIRNAKHSDKPVRLFDGGGMYLEIAPSGGKWWRLKYRHAGTVIGDAAYVAPSTKYDVRSASIKRGVQSTQCEELSSEYKVPGTR